MHKSLRLPALAFASAFPSSPAFKLDKLRAKPDAPNPFFNGRENAMRYVRVLKECNLNNWDIERALGHPQW